MSLQKKCLTASAVTHGLLLLLVFVGSAFIPQKPVIQGPEFILVDIPDELVAAPNVMSGGDPNAGSPQAQPQVVPEPQPVSVPQIPQPEPPQPTPEALPKVPEPVKEPVKPKETPREPEVKKTVDPEAFDLSKAKTISKEPAKPARPEKDFNLAKAESRKIKTTTQTKTGSSNARENDATERANSGAQAAQALASAMKAVQGTGGRVGINPDAILGPGGKAAMSYDMAVAIIYEREFKRRPIPSRSNDPAVEVEVVVRRDGTVIGKRITRPSGRAQLDRTVDEVLKSVKRVREFPSDITTETRTIKIDFNLE